jgi:hypothetical protein
MAVSDYQAGKVVATADRDRHDGAGSTRPPVTLCFNADGTLTAIHQDHRINIRSKP